MSTLRDASQTAIQNSYDLYHGGNFNDVVNGDTSQLSTSAKQYLDSKTNAQANQQRQQAGAAAAESIITHGCDIDSPDCGQKMTAVVCSVIAIWGGPYGALIAAVVEAIAQGINALNKLLNNQPACSGSANATGSWVLQVTGINLPPPGSLANAALSMMASGMAGSLNCKAYYDPAMTIMAALQAWNQNSQGKLVDYFVPKPKAGAGLGSIWKAFAGGMLPSWGGTDSVASIATGAPAHSGLFAYPQHAPYAFQPLQNVPQKDSQGRPVAAPSLEGITWIRLAGNAGPAGLPAKTSTAIATTVGSSSAVGKALVYTGIVAGVGAAGVGTYALATGTTFLGALKGLWAATGGRLVSAVNPLPVAAVGLLAEARPPTTVQTLLLPRSKFTPTEALDWARSHGYRATKTDVTAQYIRIRQKPPSEFKSGSLRTIPFGDSGIRAVVGRLR